LVKSIFSDKNAKVIKASFSSGIYFSKIISDKGFVFNQGNSFTKFRLQLKV